MAIVRFGFTRCRLCKVVLVNNDNLVVFPAFVPAGHELHDFADSAYHKDCFMNWEHHEQLQKLFASYRAVWDSRPSNMTLKEMEEWGKNAFATVFK